MCIRDSLYRETPFSIRAELEPVGEELILRRLSVKTAQGSLTATGRLFPVMDLAGEISDLDVDVLEGFWPELARQGYSGKFSTTFSAKGSWPGVTLEGHLVAPRGEVYGIDVEDLSSSWSFSGDTLEMKEVRGVADGTPLSGTLRFSFSALPPVDVYKRQG